MTAPDNHPKDWEDNYTAPEETDEFKKRQAEFEEQFGPLAKFNLPTYIDKSFMRSKGAELLKHHLSLAVNDPVVIAQLAELTTTIAGLEKEISNLNSLIYQNSKEESHKHVQRCFNRDVKERDLLRFKWLLAQYQNADMFLHPSLVRDSRQVRAGKEVETLGELYHRLRKARDEFFAMRKAMHQQKIKVGEKDWGNIAFVNNDYWHLRQEFDSMYDVYFGLDKFYTKGHVLRLIHEKHDDKVSTAFFAHGATPHPDPGYPVGLYKTLSDTEIEQFENALSKGSSYDKLRDYLDARKNMHSSIHAHQCAENRLFTEGHMSPSDYNLFLNINGQLGEAVAAFTSKHRRLLEEIHDGSFRSPPCEVQEKEYVTIKSGNGFLGFVGGCVVVIVIWGLVKWVF